MSELNRLPKDDIEAMWSLLGGRWKMLIFRELMGGPKRSGELRRSLGNITQKVLIDALRSMEESGIVTRTVFPEVPLRVEYSLSLEGFKFSPLIEEIINCVTDFRSSFDEHQELSILVNSCQHSPYYRATNNPPEIQKVDYTERIKQAKKLINESDYVIVGTGSGINTILGIDHFDREIAKRWFPHIYEKGILTLDSMINSNSVITPDNEVSYWSFWAPFIWRITYERKPSKPHQNLLKLVEKKNYFVITTNSDGQLEKTGFSPERLFSPLGSYTQLQCAFPCESLVYSSFSHIQRILGKMKLGQALEKSDIPICPLCGDYLIPNHYRNITVALAFPDNQPDRNTFIQFIEEAREGKAVFLEIGCGFRLPNMIRFPFERYVSSFNNAFLIRINSNDLTFSEDIEEQCILFPENVDQVLADLL